MKPILDPMCGSRMFYFDKNNKSVLFGDIRDETHWTRQYKKLEIHPDQIMDARDLEFPDNSFHLVILDPPHLINCGKTSDMAKSYGGGIRTTQINQKVISYSDQIDTFVGTFDVFDLEDSPLINILAERFWIVF